MTSDELPPAPISIFTGKPIDPGVFQHVQQMPPPPPPVIFEEPTDEELFGDDAQPPTDEQIEEIKEYCLSEPQYHFVMSPHKFPAMVAGYGAGKTEAGLLRALRLKFDYPDQAIGYYMPTYDLIEQIAYPRLEEILVAHGFLYHKNEKKKEVRIYGAGKIIFRTMDRPERIIGYEHCDSIADELDTLPIDKAADVWRKIVARNREKKPDSSINTIGVTTTPEGFRFVYEKWKRKPLKGSQIIKASTYSNAHNLPDDYIDTLKDNFPDAMLDAYLYGEFVNMTQGCVYPDFDRELNAAPLGVGIKPGQTLHIGIDFNVGVMAAVVHILEGGDPIAVDEFIGFLDTPALIAAIKERYVDNRSDPHRIMVYPDATGKSRKSQNASQSDSAQLRQAGFYVLANKKNPFIKDRVASVNKLIHKDGKRRYKVNIDACPHFVEALEKQAYDKNGEPDKTSGFDNINDAAGYFVYKRWPITHGRVIQTNLTGT